MRPRRRLRSGTPERQQRSGAKWFLHRKNSQKFLSATKATGVSCVLMAQSGIRPEVLFNYRGNNGLRISAIADIEISSDQVTFTNIPARIIVREELSKSRNQYFTFIGEGGASYIADHIRDRIRSGEEIRSDSQLIVPRNSEFTTSDVTRITCNKRSAKLFSDLKFKGVVKRVGRGKYRLLEAYERNGIRVFEWVRTMTA